VSVSFSEGLYIHRAVHDTALSIHALAYSALRNCRKIIDIGCGPGRLAPLFPQAKLIGVDVRAEGKMCLERGYCEFLQIDPEQAELASMQADGMVLSHVLEHFVRPERALTNALGALQSGAVVYAVCPTVNNSHYYDDYTHVRPFTASSMFGLLSDVGLAEIRILYDFQSPFPGGGRIMRLWTKGSPNLESELSNRFSFLRSGANVHALAIVPLTRVR